MAVVTLTEGTESELALAKAIAEKILVKPGDVRTTNVAKHGDFSVAVIRFFGASDTELRALFYQSPRSDVPMLVKLVFSARPLESSARAMTWSGAYEELSRVYAGTRVLVLDDRSVAEFMKRFDSLAPELNELLEHGSSACRV